MEQLSAQSSSLENGGFLIEEEGTVLPNPNDDIEVLQNLISDRYHVIKKLGKGSQGSVFLAESNDKHEKVAIKQLIIQSVKDWKQYDLFQREASTLKRINIPHVAKLHETIEMLDIETPMALIVQDFIEGAPLQKFIANGHRFQISQIGDILLQLLNILEKLHHSEPPIVHRDIKPSNIILNYVENNSSPQVYLIDFGAVANPQVKGGGSTMVGTYGYMAPEQLMGNATASSDLYSLAIVAVYLLSGVPPEELEIQDFHVLIDPHLQHLPHQFTSFLRKMLEPHEEERINNYKQLHEFFDALKTQQFNKIPNVGSSLTSKEKYSLDKVYSYRQPGNIVLWQELSDDTPRIIDKSLKSTLTKIENELSESYNSRANYQKRPSWNLSLIIIPFIVIPLTIAFCNYISFKYPELAYSTFDSGGALFITAWCILSIVITIIVLLVKFLRSHIKNYFCKKEYYKTNCNYFYFFKNARKSMATVNRIEYIPVYPSLDNNNYDTNIKYCSTWRITYGFNPPDDSSPDVLIRTFKTHFEPDFSEGDLIPILYLIEGDGNGETVYSMPYPFRVTDCIAPSKV